MKIDKQNEFIAFHFLCSRWVHDINKRPQMQGMYAAHTYAPK